MMMKERWPLLIMQDPIQLFIIINTSLVLKHPTNKMISRHYPTMMVSNKYYIIVYYIEIQ